MKSYTVRTDCEIAGVWRKGGSVIELTDKQARELAPPHGNVVQKVEDDGKLKRGKRSDGRDAD